MTVRANTLVSVIVRTKDRPGLLKTALKSIACQDYRPVEVILINDGGTDLDISTVSALLSDCTLTHIRFEKSRGRAAAGNEGILRAAGYFIGFLEDDDEFCPDHISTLVTSLEKSQHKVAYADSELVLREVDQEAGSSEVDLARFGYLFLNNGRWRDRQLVTEAWIAMARTPGPTNPYYGFMNWYLNTTNPATGQRPLPVAPPSAVMFQGNGANIVYIDRENDLLVVVRWIRGAALNEFLGKVIGALAACK